MDVEERRAVPAYRARLMDDRGLVVMSVDIMASSDLEALEKARALGYTHFVEVWDRNRLVKRIPRDPAAKA